jgi:ribokinase
MRCPRFPRAGETVLGGRFAAHPGGTGANQAVAAARMGAQVSLIGAVGDDGDGRRMRGLLAEERIDDAHVATSHEPTAASTILIAEESGENMIVAAGGANRTVMPENADRARGVIGAADVLLAQLELPLETVLHALRMARDAGTMTILNAAPIPEGAGRELLAELVAAADVLIVNRPEAEALAATAGGLVPVPCPVSRRADEDRCGLLPEDEPGFAALVGALAGLPPAASILTLGGTGAACIREGQCSMVPAFPVQAVDTVGAGDAFCGVLAVRLAEQTATGATGALAMFDALCWASAAGALATMREGAIPSLPRRAQIKALLAKG